MMINKELKEELAELKSDVNGLRKMLLGFGVGFAFAVIVIMILILIK